MNIVIPKKKEKGQSYRVFAPGTVLELSGSKGTAYYMRTSREDWPLVSLHAGALIGVHGITQGMLFEEVKHTLTVEE
jgi:hypothetical protein